MWVSIITIIIPFVGHQNAQTRFLLQQIIIIIFINSEEGSQNFWVTLGHWVVQAHPINSILLDNNTDDDAPPSLPSLQMRSCKSTVACKSTPLHLLFTHILNSVGLTSEFIIKILQWIIHSSPSFWGCGLFHLWVTKMDTRWIRLQWDHGSNVS